MELQSNVNAAESRHRQVERDLAATQSALALAERARAPENASELLTTPAVDDEHPATQENADERKPTSRARKALYGLAASIALAGAVLGGHFALPRPL